MTLRYVNIMIEIKWYMCDTMFIIKEINVLTKYVICGNFEDFEE